MNPTRRGMLCAVGAALCFGCGNTALKVIYRHLDRIPFQDLSFIRSLFCTVVFFLLVLKMDRSQLRVSRRELAFCALIGVFGMFTVQFFLLLGLQFAPVGVCSFTQSSSTIMVCVCSVLLFRERISPAKSAGIALGLAGLALFVWSRGMFQGSRTLLWGILAAFLSGVGKTVYLLGGKAAGRRGWRLTLLCYGMAAGALMGLPLSNGLGTAVSYFLDWRAALPLFGYLLCFSALPYFLTFRSIELLPASTAGSLNIIEPVASALSAFLILGEPLSWNQLAGAVPVAVSVFLIHRETGAPVPGHPS